MPMPGHPLCGPGPGERPPGTLTKCTVRSVLSGHTHVPHRLAGLLGQPRTAGRGQARGARGRTLPGGTVSCLRANGIIRFPGLLTFSLGINCERPNKYRQIALKTWIYGLVYPRRFPTLSKPVTSQGEGRGGAQPGATHPTCLCGWGGGGPAQAGQRSKRPFPLPPDWQGVGVGCSRAALRAVP